MSYRRVHARSAIFRQTGTVPAYSGAANISYPQVFFLACKSAFYASVRVSVTCPAGLFGVQDPAELWNVDNGQLSQLFDDMVKLSLDNCLVDNRWGGVACPEAKRDPSLAARPPVSLHIPWLNLQCPASGCLHRHGEGVHADQAVHVLHGQIGASILCPFCKQCCLSRAQAMAPCDANLSMLSWAILPRQQT